MQVYLALYKGKRDGKLSDWTVLKARIGDALTRFFTRGKYSHCEIAVKNGSEFDCYSSSIRDGGVRVKTMPLPSEKWDLIELPDTENVKIVFEKTRGKKYDWLRHCETICPRF